MKRLSLALLASALLVLGCAGLDHQQRQWIFQPGDRSWSGGSAAAQGMQDVWIEFDSRISGQPVRLHGLWLDADAADGTEANAATQAPVLLYLHGSRWNVTGSALRMRRMQALGFSVLAIDYRGFGRSDAVLPSEAMAYEDARAAWDWLAQRHPARARHIFGHSLGAAIAIDLAAQVADEAATLVEGGFTSLPELVRSFKWGWLPIGPLITQRFEAVNKVAQIGSPLLVVHGEADRLIPHTLGRRLFEAAAEPKAFVLVPGGSHHNTHARAQDQYRAALDQLLGPCWRTGAGRAAEAKGGASAGASATASHSACAAQAAPGPQGRADPPASSPGGAAAAPG